MAAWVYTIAPVLAAALGAVITTWRKPGPAIVSTIQHFAAGVVFAAAAGEILPEVMHGASPAATIVGGAIGVATMLLVKKLEEHSGGRVGMLATIGVDVFIDGLVLGLAFIGGKKAGVLLTIALTLEVLFLGLSVASEQSERQSNRWRAIGTVVGLALLLPLGAIVASPVSLLPAIVITGFLSFGLMALLYLVTEELLVEAHEKPDNVWTTSAFFVGFLGLLALEEIIP